ncbi:MAG: hypothetical protein IBX41_09355 [Methanophagales archaeon]|nr:hypothetical protein [Methanophagales archaeon]
MKVNKEDWGKRELKELLEREALFLEILRKLHERVQTVFARPESLEKLAKELKACEAQIVKRYFFPVDKTIEAFTTKQPSISREELITASEEDREQLLLFIDVIDKEVKNKEEEIKKLKEETKKLHEML